MSRFISKSKKIPSKLISTILTTIILISGLITGVLLVFQPKIFSPKAVTSCSTILDTYSCNHTLGCEWNTINCYNYTQFNCPSQSCKIADNATFCSKLLESDCYKFNPLVGGGYACTWDSVKKTCSGTSYKLCVQNNSPFNYYCSNCSVTCTPGRVICDPRTTIYVMRCKSNGCGYEWQATCQEPKRCYPADAYHPVASCR